MQRKGNAVKVKSQSQNLVTVGIDMGGALWATAVYDWASGKNRYYGFKDKEDKIKEERAFDLVDEMVKNGNGKSPNGRKCRN